MRLRKIMSICASLVIFPALILSISIEAAADTLYGIVYSGANEGFLIEIDSTTGDATPLFDTGLDSPCVLTFNSRIDKLITSNCFGFPPQGFTIDLATSVVSQFSDPFSPNDELAYRFIDDMLFAVNAGVGTSTLHKLDPVTGDLIDTVGVINKGPVTGLAVDTSQEILYGTGLLGGNQWLFTAATSPGPPPLETDVVQVNTVEPVLSGVVFGSNGTLYATDGQRLSTLDKTNGNVTWIGPFGTDIGFVSDIALVPDGTDGRLIAIYPKLNFIPLHFPLAEMVKDGYPWCPPGFPGCPGNRLSINIEKTDLPLHMVMLGRAVQEIAGVHSDSESFGMAIQEFKEIVNEVPLGAYFDNEIRRQLIRSIDNATKQANQTTSSAFLTSPIIIESLNAIELDWRLPELNKHEISKGKFVGIDLDGIVWVGLRDVVKPGNISLEIENNYKAFPVGSKFSPSWPFLSYTIDFNVELGSKGFVDLEFYIKPLRFKNQVTAIRVLQLAKGGLIDVTTGRDLSRGTVMARTDRPGSFIIVGRD